MPASTERLVWTFCPLAYSTETIINLLAVLVGVCIERLRSNTLRITPSGRVPLRGVNPDTRVNLADSGRREYVVAFWDDIGAIFGGRSESRGNRDISTDIAHDTVNRWVNAERLANDGIKDWKLAEGLIGHRAETTVGVAEVINLLLVKGRPMMKKVSTY